MPPVCFDPSSVPLSLATGSLLVGTLGVRALGQWLQEIGIASEELFRGDRLPVLPFPSPSPDSGTNNK